MDFDENYLIALLKEVSGGKDIKLSDIPDIDLYMDQVTTFIDNRLGYRKRGPDDKILTKTMINNYTKFKILLPSKNKKYNRQHMILLILIYYLKQILSINDINALFSPLFKNTATEKKAAGCLDEIYEAFLDIKSSGIGDMENILSQKLRSIEEKTANYSGDSKETSKMLLTVLMLVAQADLQKRMAEKIIDKYFETKK